MYDIPKVMRALVLTGRGFDKLSIQKISVPKPNINQLLARVDAAGICTSLLKLIEQGSNHHLLSGWDVTRWPIILGDEGCITIVQVGENLKRTYSIGQRFIIQPSVDHSPINHIERYNNKGRGVLKVAVGYTLGGHLAEYILVTEEILNAGCLIPIPSKQITYAHAAITEPISCVISSQDHHIHLNQDDPKKDRLISKGLLKIKRELQLLSGQERWGEFT